MKASIIIPCYKRPDWLRKTIISVLEQLPQNCEIITIYQNSEDDEELHSWCNLNNVHYIFSSFPSTTRARNAGLDVAKGEIVIYFDDDVELLPGCIAAHCSAYNAPSVVGVAGRVITYRAGGPDTEKSGVKEIGRVDLLGRLHGDQNYNSHQSLTSNVTPLGCNMSFRANALKKIRFDENYRGNALREETDTALRILQFGSILFEPKAAVKHFLAKDGGSRSKPKSQWYLDYFFNVSYFMRGFVKPALLHFAYLTMVPYGIKYFIRYGRSYSSFSAPFTALRQSRQERSKRRWQPSD